MSKRYFHNHSNLSAEFPVHSPDPSFMSVLKHEQSCFQGKQTDLFVFPFTAPRAALFNFSAAPHLLIAWRALAPAAVKMGKINQIMPLIFYLHATLYINLWGWGLLY